MSTGQTTSKPSKYSLQTTKALWPLIKEDYLRVHQAKQEGRPVAWTMAICPKEILLAMDVESVMVEQHSASLAGKGEVVKFLQVTEAKGYSGDSCTYHRAFLGYAFAEEPLMIPKPDFILATTNPCDGASRSCIPVAEVFDIPYIFLDTPRNTRLGGPEDIADYMVEYYQFQLEQLITFLEGLSNKKLDPERLRHTCELSRQANALWREISDLRKAIPCPMGVVDELVDIYPIFQSAGTQPAIDIYQRLKAEVEERVAKGIGVIDEEKYRLLWLGTPLWPDMEFLRYFEQFGAVLVKSDLDLAYYGELDPAKPLESISRKMIAEFLNGILENRIELVKNLVRDYKIDGVVIFAHWGCRQYGGGHRAVKDAVSEEFGIPCLMLEGDSIDPRNNDPQEIRDKTEGFIELLGG